MGRPAVDGDGAGFRAGEETEPASGAAVAVIYGWMVAAVVQVHLEAEDPRRTGLHAKTTSFALSGVDGDVSFIWHSSL